ncbi:MAG: acylneuraminate cytidylyltransferase [Chloroflexi bacterium]|nr:acylneuraminate cytidylyltransferase [Chloroflexota bacterium]
MVARTEVLAVIPARGGSKGIPRKNIRDFAGFPLIAYSITAGLQAECVTRTIVSTEDEEIAATARELGAEVPFLRPAEMAQDNSLDLPLFQHLLAQLAEREGYHPDVVVQLRPTSPIRPHTCVDDAVKLLLEHPEADSVRGVVPAGQNPHKMWRIDPQSGQMTPLLSVEGIAEPYNAPRQVLPPVYWQTGHIDAIRPAVILEQNSMSGRVKLPLMLNPRYTVDIDNLTDWQRAEWLVYHGGLDMVDPAKRRRPLPDKIELVVLDFDGVITDNRVWTDEEGHEMVAAFRSDGFGLRFLRSLGIPMIVISAEVNKVVAARCRKMRLPVVHGVEDKVDVLTAYMKENNINPQHVVFLGNDINDVPCFSVVGCGVVVADSQPVALRQADLVLTRPGGHGAVRELAELIVQKMEGR